LTDTDSTNLALAGIASVLDAPDPTHDAEKPAINEEPVPGDAHGYSKAGPGPMAALRFKWTVNRGEDGQYYVQETIGEHSTPITDGPMTGEAAVKLVDERASQAHHRFEALRNEMLGRVAELAQKRSGEG